ncbi:MAG TPA: glycoside hydrolase family 2 TIM barrel-domain containing protein [Burkholderiales bacterium]|nr:glycoside hydrolase family 2 TIM barrel-domain containing protein [Burkholderiales bacterium]
MDQAAYPRPQFERAHWLSLDGIWRFLFDDNLDYKRPSDIKHWPLDIRVPMPPESVASGIGDRGFHRCCWYEREFDIRADGQRVILHFGAVDYSARVWVNGHLVAEHEGGHTPFAADITDALSESGTHTVTVQAEDDPQDLAKPRGKQDWQAEPHSIWYPRTTGIWQTVWLERVNGTHISKILWTPHFERFEIAFEAFVEGKLEDDLTIDVRLYHGEHLLSDDRYKVIMNEVHRGIALSDPGIDDSRNELLWSPERPTLLQAEIRLRQGDRVLDEIKSYTALRSVNILRDRFMLNGRPYILRLVLDQGYWPDTLLAAPDDDALRKDVELAKAMGFNGVRKHQKVENPRYLYWADRLGLLVWEEMPSAYRFTRKAVSRLVQEWTEVIERDYSHPCVIVWVPFNESWGVPDLPSTPQHRNAVEALYHLTKTLDSTRPVIGNDGWESSATDMIGIHDYDANLEHMQSRYGADVKREDLLDRRRPGGRVLTLDGYPARGQPVILTEFGGIAYAKCPQPGVDQIWGYSKVESDKEFAERYSELLNLINNISMFSGFCYTQFADTFQEANGLLCADRTPKIPLKVISEATRISRTHIPGVV